MDVTIVRFANGSSLTFKHTDFERGSVQVRLRFGNGVSGLRPDRPSLAWLGGAGRPVGGRRSRSRRARTAADRAADRAELRRRRGCVRAARPDQRRSTLATSCACSRPSSPIPRWDGDCSRATKANALRKLRSRLRVGRVARRPRVRRLQPQRRPALARRSSQGGHRQGRRSKQFQAFFAPLLAAGPIEAIIVGDVESRRRRSRRWRRASARCRARAPTPLDPTTRGAKPPAPGRSASASPTAATRIRPMRVIGWSTLGGIEHVRERRALSARREHDRRRELFDRLREDEGATYSPSAAATSLRNASRLGHFLRRRRDPAR